MEMDLPDMVEGGHDAEEQIGEARLILNGEIIAAVPLVLGETLAERDYAYEMDRLLRSWPSVPQTIAK